MHYHCFGETMHFQIFFFIVINVNGEIALENVLFKMFVSKENIYTFDLLRRTSITDIVYHKIKKHSKFVGKNAIHLSNKR